jgi:hypothetical protein
MFSRRLLIVDADRGLVEAEVRSDAVASKISEHHAALRRYLEGDESGLVELRRTVIRIGDERHRLETDPARIEDLALAGELDYDDIYVLG